MQPSSFDRVGDASATALVPLQVEIVIEKSTATAVSADQADPQ
jgi:hypothetical protein